MSQWRDRSSGQESTIDKVAEPPLLDWNRTNQPTNKKPLTIEAQKILERTQRQWEAAEWSNLSKLDPEIIKSHPQRERLALLVAASKLQNGEMSEIREIVKLAKNWGASKELTARALLSGVHETLGRANIIADQKEKAIRHFEYSAEIGSPRSDAGLLAHRRFVDSSESSIKNYSANDKTQKQRKAICESNQELDDPHIISCRLIRLTDGDREQPISEREVSCREIEYGNEKFSFYFRKESTGDIGVIKQIFEEKQYEFGWLPQGKLIYGLHQETIKRGKKPLIIDGGANIGASSIWLGIKFPGATVLAIEPNQDNCELIKRNCSLKEVLLYCGGLSNKPQKLSLQDPGESDWGFRVVQHGEGNIDCLGVPDILGLFDSNVFEPFILKLDIEGSEALVFEGKCEWMKAFSLIIVELHDWMLPNQGSSANFIKAVSLHGFELVTRGENIFCFNRKLYP